MKAKSGLLFSIALLCLLTACDSTQVVNLSGRVYNSKTQLPVANATVSDGLYGFKNSAVTDTTGYYSYETYCEEHSINPEDLKLVICEPNYLRGLDYDYWDDVWPEESEPPKELQKLVDALNEYCRTAPPVSWQAGKMRTTVKISDSRLLIPIDDLDISVRAFMALKAAEIKTLGDLVIFKATDLLKFRNFGKKSIQEIQEVLEKHGLKFKE